MAAVGRLSHLVIDCTDADRLAEFWSEALGVEVAARWHQYVMLTPTSEGAPAVAFQEVPEPKQGKNRVHVDLEVADLDEASARDRGARRLGARATTSRTACTSGSSPIPRATSSASC